MSVKQDSRHYLYNSIPPVDGKPTLRVEVQPNGSSPYHSLPALRFDFCPGEVTKVYDDGEVYTQTLDRWLRGLFEVNSRSHNFGHFFQCSDDHVLFIEYWSCHPDALIKMWEEDFKPLLDHFHLDTHVVEYKGYDFSEKRRAYMMNKGWPDQYPSPATEQ